MQKNLNEDFIDSYCEKFAAKITDTFFSADRESITGKEILDITPSKQTNFFVIKLIFSYWQGETKRLESPFFNYGHQEVQDALTEFMNVLSQHIEIHKNRFQLLLNHAVKDAIYLAASPHAFLEIDLDGMDVDKVDDQFVEDTIKYIKIYKKDIRNFLSDMRGLSIDDVIDELTDEFEEFDSTEGLSKETALLSEILPISANQVMTEEFPEDFDDFDDDDEVFDNDDPVDEQPKETPKEEEPKDPSSLEWATDIAEDIPAEDNPTSSESNDASSEASNQTYEPPRFDDSTFEDNEALFLQEMEKRKAEINFEESDTGEAPPQEEEQPEESIVQDQEDKEEILPETPEQAEETTPEPKEEIPPVEPEDEGPTSSDSEEPSESIEETKPTVNDTFDKNEKTVAEHHEEKQSSLMKAISVNQQYMFVKELFDDDNISFQNALYELEEQASFDEAVEFLVQGYAKEFKWDMQSTEVKELLKVLFRKFRD